MDKSNIKPVEGIVKETWLNIRKSRTPSSELHIVLEEFPGKEFTFDSFSIRVDKGERVRLWERDSHPNLGIGGSALQIIDKNGDVKFTVGLSTYNSMGGRCSYNFKLEHLD